MKILLSNDDGYLAPGINCMKTALEERGHHVVMVAPDRNRSAASNSLTLDVPLRPQFVSDTVIYVENGTPTDCVHIALTGLLEDFEPDMVVSGINHGANMGDDTLYSGTVAAATEGRFLGKTTLAVSLVGDQNFETAAKLASDLVDRIDQTPLAFSTILNLNVPDIPLTEVKGLKTVRLGQRHKAETVVKTTDPRGKTIYWIGPAGEAADEGEGTDFHAIEQGYATLTPLQIDLTDHKGLTKVTEWLND